MLRRSLEPLSRCCRICFVRPVARAAHSARSYATPSFARQQDQRSAASAQASSTSASSPLSAITETAFSRKSKTKKPTLKATQLRKDRSSFIRPAQPDGQAIAFSTAEKYDIDALRKQLWNKNLLGRGDGKDATNLMGEAIYIPHWPLEDDSNASASPSNNTQRGDPSSAHQAGPPGEIFIFETGSYVAWHMSQEQAAAFADTVLRPATALPGRTLIDGGSDPVVEVSRHDEDQVETMDFVIRADEVTGVRDDVIIIGTSNEDAEAVSAEESAWPTPRKSPLATAIDPLPAGSSKSTSASPGFDFTAEPLLVRGVRDERRARLPKGEEDLHARLSFSIGLARSTKLAVYEEMLDDFIEEFSSIPEQLTRGSDAPLSKRDIVRHTGLLLKIRQYLNLVNENNLMDMPEFFWISSNPLSEVWFKEITRNLETNRRVDILNRKLDYCLQVQSTLQDLESTKVSHRLEWIIIILIAIEIGLALIREGVPGFNSSHKQRALLTRDSSAPTAV